MAAFTSGLIIVLNVWGSQKSGLLQNLAKEMANVQICLNVLKEGEKRYTFLLKIPIHGSFEAYKSESRWHLAGRL